MNYFHRILATLLFSLFTISLFAQAYQPPAPKMTNNVLKQFFNTHLVYPPNALNNKEQGAVRILYNIDEKGQIVHREIIASVSNEIDSAALVLFDLIIWKPAYNYGKPIKGDGEFKIKYNVGKYESMVKKRGYDQATSPIKAVDNSGTIYNLKNLDFAPEALLDQNYLSVQDYIAKNLVYPESALKVSISGEVKLRYVIETNGLPSNIMIIEPVGGGCTEEAIRIVQQIYWTPGIKDGKAVRTCYNVSIKFDPADQLKSKHIPNQSNSGM